MRGQSPRCSPGSLLPGGGSGRWKCIEPQDRNRDATSSGTWTHAVRRSGEEPQGRHHSRDGQSRPTAKPSGPLGEVERDQGETVEGHTRECQERRIGEGQSGIQRGSSKETPRPWGAATSVLQTNRALQRESLEGEVR
jgi:hypothetical protein